jgi:hypothetical protein
MRPVVWECDGCGNREETVDYGLPEGWVHVKADAPRTRRAPGEADFCGRCGLAVDALRVVKSGRPWDSPKPKATRKKKAEPEVEIEGDVDPEALAEALLDGVDHSE